MEDGWVYVLVNSSMPGVAKVGRTTRSAHERAAELSGVTGIATPFIVAYEHAFADCQAAEQAIHAELDSRGLRISPNREFFGGTASDIIRLVIQAGAEAGFAAGNPPTQASQPAEAFLAAGDRARYGLGTSLQDTGEAIRCYKLAAARGAIEAWARLGSIYVQLYARKRDRAGRRRAMGTLKEGVRKGDIYCYCRMADVFALEGHSENVAKAWALFFAGVADRSQECFAEACGRYIAQCLDLQSRPAHLPELREAAEAIVGSLLKELDLAKGDPAERRRLAACLRWALRRHAARAASVATTGAGEAVALGNGDGLFGLGKSKQSFFEKRTKKLLTPLSRPWPEKHATAKQKSFASFLQKRRPFLLSEPQKQRICQAALCNASLASSSNVT